MNLKKWNHESTTYIFHLRLLKSHTAFLLLRHLGGSVSTVLAVSVCSILPNPRGMRVLLYTFDMVTNADTAVKDKAPSIKKDLRA